MRFTDLKKTKPVVEQQEILVEYDRNKTAQALGDKLIQTLIKSHTSAIPDNLIGAHTVLSMASNPSRYHDKTISMSMFGQRVSFNPQTAPETAKEIMPHVVSALLADIEAQDPTQNKEYTQWLARSWTNAGGTAKIEDMNRNNMVAYHAQAKQKRNFLPAEARDINRFKTYKAFEDWMYENNIKDKLDADLTDKEIDRGDSETVYDGPTARVIVPGNQQAACYYGQGTRWCTAATGSHNYFDHYHRQGTLYIILPKKQEYEGEKYQLHFYSQQFMNEQDDPVDLLWIMRERFPELKELFLELEPHMKSFVAFTDDKVLEGLGKVLGEYIMDHVWEAISEWEHNDDYYYTEQREAAQKYGFWDEENEQIDYDKIEEIERKTGHNLAWVQDYTEYNDEAYRFLRDMRSLENLSADTIRDYADEYLDHDEEGMVSLTDLPDIYAEAVRASNGDYIASLLNRGVWLRPGDREHWERAGDQYIYGSVGGYTIGRAKPKQKTDLWSSTPTTNESRQFQSKQEMIAHFVRIGKTAAQGAAAWERQQSQPKKPATDMKNLKFKKSPVKYWNDIDESLVEGASAVLYHKTGIYAALEIIKSGEFKLASTTGNKNEQDLAPKGYPFYLSTTRSKVGDYHRWVGSSAVMFVLDGNKIAHNYKVKPVDYWQRSWQHSPDRTRESEDRVFGKTNTMPIDSLKEIHVLLDEQDDRHSEIVRQLLIAAKSKDIKTYLYDDAEAWRLQDKRRVVKAKHYKYLLSGHREDPPYMRRPVRGLGRGQDAYGRSSLLSWIELIKKHPGQELTKQADKIRYNLRYYGDMSKGLETDLFNANKPDSTEYELAVKLAHYLNKKNLSVFEFTEMLKKKWSEPVNEDLDRRGFLRGALGAGVAAAGLGFSDDSEAGIRYAIEVVEPGDTIDSIAFRNGLTRQQLIRMNNLKSEVRVGQRLRVPDSYQAVKTNQTKQVQAKQGVDTSANGEMFAKKLYQVASALQVQPGDLLTVMKFETKGTLSPSISNKQGAVGLIQFMPNTARDIGTTTKALARMNAVQQLSWVYKYYKRQGLPAGAGLAELYLMTLFPALAKRRLPDNHIVAANPHSENPKVARISKTPVVPESDITRSRMWKANPAFKAPGRDYYTVADIKNTIISRA